MPNNTMSEEEFDPIRVFTIKVTSEMAITGKVPEKILELEEELADSFRKLINQEVLEAIAEIKTIIVPYARTDEVLNYIKQVEKKYKGETIL